MSRHLLALALLAASMPRIAGGATVAVGASIGFEHSARLAHRAGTVSVGPARRQVINVLSSGASPDDETAALRLVCTTSALGWDCGRGVLHGALAGTIRLADEPPSAASIDIAVVYQ